MAIRHGALGSAHKRRGAKKTKKRLETKRRMLTERAARKQRKK